MFKKNLLFLICYLVLVKFSPIDNFFLLLKAHRDILWILVEGVSTATY